MVGTAHHHGIIVSDVERSAAFYTDVLGFEQVDSRSMATEPVAEVLGVEDADISVVMIEANGFLIELVEFTHPPNDNIHESNATNDVGVAHFAIGVEDLEATFADIEDEVDYISEPKTLENLGGLKAVYIKDPDGNPIELLEEP